jgi:hypothetical protein
MDYFPTLRRFQNSIASAGSIRHSFPSLCAGNLFVGIQIPYGPGLHSPNVCEFFGSNGVVESR